MDNKENKRPVEELAEGKLDEVSGGTIIVGHSTSGILSDIDDLLQQKPDPDAKPKLGVL